MGKKGHKFFFLDSKITVIDDCCHEIIRHLLFGRKAMTNLDSVLKSRDRTLLTNIHIVMVLGGASGKEPTCLCRRHKRGGIDQKISWRRHGNPLQDSCLENPMNWGAWLAMVHGVVKSQTQLKRLSTAHIHIIKAMVFQWSCMDVRVGP